MFEGNTMLAGLAARTSTIALGLLVAGVGYRNPAQHAKITTTLDVISGGPRVPRHRRGLVRGRAPAPTGTRSRR